MEFRARFTVIGEDQEQQTDDLAPPGAGDVFSIDQDLFEEVGESWNRPGDPVGEAHGSGVVTKKDLAMCSITFTFGDEDIIVAHGLLPSNGRRLGNGLLAVTGGTGRFDRVSGRLEVESRNPKRWGFFI